MPIADGGQKWRFDGLIEKLIAIYVFMANGSPIDKLLDFAQVHLDAQLAPNPPKCPNLRYTPLRNGWPRPNPDHALSDVRALVRTHLARPYRGRGLEVGRCWRPPLAPLGGVHS